MGQIGLVEWCCCHLNRGMASLHPRPPPLVCGRNALITGGRCPTTSVVYLSEPSCNSLVSPPPPDGVCQVTQQATVHIYSAGTCVLACQLHFILLHELDWPNPCLRFLISSINLLSSVPSSKIFQKVEMVWGPPIGLHILRK